MEDFTLKMGNTEYVCSNSNYGQGSKNWHIRAQVNDLSVTMTIPKESKVSRSQCMLFIEVFHEALTAAKKVQKETLQNPQQLS